MGGQQWKENRRAVQTVFSDISFQRPLPELVPSILVLSPVAISKPKTRMAGSSPAMGFLDRGIATAAVPALPRDRSTLLEWRMPGGQLLRFEQGRRSLTRTHQERKMCGLPKAALLELRRCRKSLPICLKLSCFLLFSTSGIMRFQLFGADLLSRRARCDAAAALATDRRAFAVDLL